MEVLTSGKGLPLHREQLDAEADEPMLQREAVAVVPVQVGILEADDPVGAEEDDEVDGAQQDQQLESDFEDDEGIAAGDAEAHMSSHLGLQHQDDDFLASLEDP